MRITFDFNFDFVNEFINRGFDIKFTDIFGIDITSQIVNNERLEVGVSAHDRHSLVMFFAQKK